MPTRNLKLLICGMAALLMLQAPLAVAATAATVDLNQPAQKLEAYVRTVGDTSGKAVTTYAFGTVYAYVPGEKPRALFNLEVVGMGRYVKATDGYQRLSREIGYYTDLQSGEILTRWFNPYLQREVEVIPIQNDPVNRKFTVQNATYKVMEQGDSITFYREVPLRYPNALDRAGYPLYSSGDFYEAMEMFNNFVSRADLENERLTSLPSAGSWARLGPWLPWMEMALSPGSLVYHARSNKVLNGIEGLRPALREYIASDNPKYLQAPAEFSAPDETSWTFFKKLIDARRAAAKP